MSEIVEQVDFLDLIIGLKEFGAGACLNLFYLLFENVDPAVCNINWLSFADKTVFLHNTHCHPSFVSAIELDVRHSIDLELFDDLQYL